MLWEGPMVLYDHCFKLFLDVLSRLLIAFTIDLAGHLLLQIQATKLSFKVLTFSDLLNF